MGPLCPLIERASPGIGAVERLRATGIIAGMRVLLASEPGRAGRPNEDFAAAVPGAVVLLDGAGYEPPSGIGCVHGIAWYARTLGGLLAAAVTMRPPSFGKCPPVPKPLAINLKNDNSG